MRLWIDEDLSPSLVDVAHAHGLDATCNRDRGLGRRRLVYHEYGTLPSMATTKPRIQVTLDAELAAAVAELGGIKPRSRAVRDLALRGAEAIRSERDERRAALDFLRALDAGEEDGYDFVVSEQLHAERR